METYRVLRIEEQLYGCEELPEGQPVLCDVLLENAAGERRVLPYPDAELTALDINEGDTIALTDYKLSKVKSNSKEFLCTVSILPATARPSGTLKIRSAA